MISPTPTPMPGWPQRLAAFGGFCLYLLTAVQIEEHKTARRQLLEAIPMPGPVSVHTIGRPITDWDHGSTDDDREQLHDLTPHIHAGTVETWPHTHDG